MNVIPFVPATGIEKRFAWLSAIPHGSKNEKALSDAILHLAEEAGLESYQDDLGNLLVRKPATPGMEGCPAVILQAHMDMVCAKIPESKHDFVHDPLTLLVEDGNTLRADGTTLGADDGYGVAYMLETLFGEGSVHPPLECLFTVQEEIGLIGASHFDLSKIRARRMISMDSGGENMCVVSTCGGRRITFTLPLKKVEAGGKVLKLTVAGLTGGHSAGEIHRGRANAIKVLSHILINLRGAHLVHAEGGEAANAIPRDAWAKIIVDEGNLDSVRNAFEAVRERMFKLYSVTDPNMTLTLETLDEAADVAYDLAAASMIVALPDGVRRNEPLRPDVRALSDNVGVLRQQDGHWTVQCMIRSANPEHCELLTEEMLAAGCAYGASAELDSDYPGMEYDPHSVMRAHFAECVCEVVGRELVETSTHGGMEIGYFSRRIPGLDIVTLGPFSEGCHSPSETLDLASFNRMYTVLQKLLARKD